jgi:hypothetical protein
MTIEPNLPGPSKAQMIYVPVGVFTVICPLLVGLRFWARLRKGGKLGPDDYSITAALVSYVSWQHSSSTNPPRPGTNSSIGVCPGFERCHDCM